MCKARHTVVPLCSLKDMVGGGQGKPTADVVAMLSCFVWQEMSEQPPALPIRLAQAHRSGPDQAPDPLWLDLQGWSLSCCEGCAYLGSLDSPAVMEPR